MPTEKEKQNLEQAWQEQIEKEKQESKDQGNTFRKPNFVLLVSSLSMQAMIAMGKIKSPLSEKKEKNLEQARFLIETLPILQEKTQDNLTDQERVFLEDSIYHLRENYLKTRSQDDR